MSFAASYKIGNFVIKYTNHMSLILNIETATEICSVALSKNGKLVAIKEDTEGQQHAKMLTVLIEQLFSENNISIKELKAVAVSMGPGSYTGLRIGVSAAKGIAYAADVPLIAINTLQAMAYGISKNGKYEPDTWFCPMIDARRMEVYTTFFDINNKIMRDIAAEIIDENSFSEILEKHKVIFHGNGASKCKQSIKSPNAQFVDNEKCSALNMIELSHQAFQNHQFVDVAYFEPFYLKDFIATVPKNSVLG
jgi:tRNA threonylcarbamoyladenosine biosynthesis protein TsaB